MVNNNDSRHNARKVALFALFEWAFRPVAPSEGLENAKEFIGGGSFKSALAQELVAGVRDNIVAVDKIIAASAVEWPVSQIAKIDLSILRLAIYELKFSKDNTPPKVVIDEAVELAKEYGAENSPKFINGALGTLYKDKSKV